MRIKNTAILLASFLLVASLGAWAGYGWRDQQLPASITFVPDCEPAI